MKRIIDLLLSTAMLVILSPLCLGMSLLLVISNQGSPFFRQRRVGKNSEIFTLFKFKTMVDRYDNHGVLLPDEQRLTPLGKFVRKTSFDEVPQLINVIMGNMSLVGPRPLLVDYLPYYNEFQNRRHEVRPGITGFAQINGRNSTNWDRRFELDVFYVQNISFKLDVQILAHTIVKVVRSEGINAEGHATMPRFSDYVKSQGK